VVIIDQQEIKDKWKEYLEKLFYDQRPNECCFENQVITGPRILTTEVEAAIKNMKNGKATGPNNVEAEFLKLLHEGWIKWITRIFNNIYDTGNIPK